MVDAGHEQPLAVDKAIFTVCTVPSGMTAGKSAAMPGEERDNYHHQ